MFYYQLERKTATADLIREVMMKINERKKTEDRHFNIRMTNGNPKLSKIMETAMTTVDQD